MHPDKVGDSYDIVKQSILRWLKGYGAWDVHPMFTACFKTGKKQAYMSLLGVSSLLTTDLVPSKRKREDYLAPARSSKNHVFLDPDKGLTLQQQPRPLKKYLMISELVAIVGPDKLTRPDMLTLVYDQSIDRRESTKSQIKKKLSWLADHGVYGCAYESHACFILVSAEKSKHIVHEAADTFLRESGLPRDRLVRLS